MHATTLSPFGVWLADDGYVSYLGVCLEKFLDGHGRYEFASTVDHVISTAMDNDGPGFRYRT